MRRLVLLIYIGYILVMVNSQLHEIQLQETRNVDQVLFNCFQHITSVPVNKGILIIYSKQKESEMYIKQIYNMTSPIILMNLNESHKEIVNTDWHYRMVVIITETIEGIEAVLKQLYLTPIWKPRSRYLIVYHGDDIMDNIFQLAFKKYILNLNVILRNDSNIYSYFPYRNGNCGEKIKTEVLGTCYHTPRRELYPEKVPKVLNGCLIRIIAGWYVPGVIDIKANSVDPSLIGYEVKMTNTILEKMNLTQKKIMPNITGYPYKLPNGSYTYHSLLYYLYEDLHDMAYARTHLNESFVYDFDATRIYYQDPLKWHAPSAELGAQWISVVLIFQDTLWYIVFGMLFVNAIIWWVFSRATGNIRTFTECLLGSLIVLLNGSVPLPRRSAMRYLVTAWTLFALLLIAMYQSKLLSILLKPVYTKQIATEEDIVDSGLNIIILKHHFIALKDGNPVQRRIATIGKQVDYMTYVTHRSNYTKDIIFIGSEMTTKYLIPWIYLDRKGKKMLYIFKDQHVQFLNCMYFRKGFPFFEQFNRMLSYVLYSGLLNKWIKDVVIVPPDMENPQRIPLNVNHLGCAFLFLGIGYIISMFTLLLEIIIYKISQRNNT